MIRFSRQLTLKNSSYVPKAMGWAGEFTGWMNEKYDLELKFGLEMFGGLKVTWFMDADSLGDVEAVNQKILADTEYWGWVEKSSEFWVNGSLKDTVVNVM
jgi:hypothetical protein